ncbi:MAG: formate dehydrogenase accessory sulfurtransferase FdhD [Casimicrobiaceae bacterium]
MSSAARPSTVAVPCRNECGETIVQAVAGEHPLTVYVDRREVLTLMTLGAAPEALVLGYLRNQRLVERIEDIVSVQVDWDVNAASVVTRSGLVDLEDRLAHRTKTTGCGSGTVFGDLMADIDAIRLPPEGEFRQSTLYAIGERVRHHETIYKQAGAVHGCALFSANAELLYFVEDVGRHNAVDAIAGMMWLDGVGGSDKIFYTTGRLTSEMVIKAAQMRVSCLVSRSGLTQMGLDIARQVGMTLIGRAVNRRFLIFNDPGRFIHDVPAAPGAAIATPSPEER